MQFAGVASANAERPMWTAFDAVDFSRGNPNDQTQPEQVIRELNKAWAAFALPWRVNPPKLVATGNWGAGAFKGDAQLKALIQWAAASEAGKQTVSCFA